MDSPFLNIVKTFAKLIFQSKNPIALNLGTYINIIAQTKKWNQLL